MNDNPSPLHILPVGTLLQGGRYRIDAFLKSGGFGNTYRTTDTRFEETVAIKEFFMREVNERDSNGLSVSVSNADSRSRFEEQRNKFVREARRIYKLKQENIIRVTDLFEENNTAYYVMEYIDGLSLSDYVREHGALSAEQARKLLTQLLNALEVVHSEGLYHLDIKPSNIMLDTTRHRAVLIDFGASKQVDPDQGVTMSTALCFTPGYAPIEQVDNNAEDFGPWTDLYSLGATLYKVLTLNDPPSVNRIITKGMDAFAFGEQQSSDMRHLISWMMQASQNKRPQKVEHVRAWLTAHPNVGGALVTENTRPSPRPDTTGNGSNAEETQLIGHGQSIRTFKCNGVEFSMAHVEGGTFTMGALPNDKDAFDDETPRHQVTLSSFYISKYEVTQELWQAVMGSNPSYFKGDLQRPVETVSWDDCQTFIRKLNALTGEQFRLPTEAEWEYAARGGQKSRGYLYSGSNDIADVAWYDDNSGDGTHPVGRKQPNELGLYDMSGNVWEWCEDWYGPYSRNAQTNPTGPSSASNRVLRGGCWGSSAWGCRASSRFNLSPDAGDDHLGLRLALLTKEQEEARRQKEARKKQQEEARRQKEARKKQQEATQEASDAEEQPLPPMLTRRSYTPIYIATAIGAVALVFILVIRQQANANRQAIFAKLQNDMVYVEGGTFTMGALPNEKDAYDDETPRHQVTLSSFYISKYEVTQELWQAVMGSNPSYFKGDLQRPVECVSWDDCQTFIRKLNALTGEQFRLPTEAEWEYAARGGQKSRGYLYSGSNDIADVAWYDDNSGDGTHPVGRKQPNELGLYDMSGNVWEWCEDWYGPYSRNAQTNPSGPSSASGRVARGGSWDSNAGDCRASCRGGSTPDLSDSHLGLRLAR